MLRVIVYALALVSVIPAAQAHARHHHGRHGTPWCGIYLSNYLGKHDRNLALAREWAHEGAAAPGPAVGVVAVWPHHVGFVVSGAGAGSRRGRAAESMDPMMPVAAASRTRVRIVLS